MTFDDDFYQMMLDYFSIEQQRHQSIMATLTDVTSVLAAMNTAIDAKIAAHAAALTALKASVDKAIADLTDTGAAGHSAVLDTIVTALGSATTKVEGIDSADQVTAMTSQITAAITAVPVPKVG